MGRLHTKDVFGKPFKGLIIPFGSLVEYYTISSKDQSRIHQFGKKVSFELFNGYPLYARGIWKGDIMVAETVRSWNRWTHQKSTLKYSMQRKVYFPKKLEKFPVADGRIKFSGGDQELRTPTLIREHPIRGGSHRDFLGESEGSLLPPPQDSFPDAGERTNDFWYMTGNFIYRHHVEPRDNYSPREESFLSPLKDIGVSRSRTNLVVMQERRIDDNWNIDESRDLFDSWVGFTQFTLLEEKLPDGCVWSGWRLTKRQVTSRPDYL